MLAPALPSVSSLEHGSRLRFSIGFLHVIFPFAYQFVVIAIVLFSKPSDTAKSSLLFSEIIFLCDRNSSNASFYECGFGMLLKHYIAKSRIIYHSVIFLINY